jgi:hypothetical protein
MVKPSRDSYTSKIVPDDYYAIQPVKIDYDVEKSGDEEVKVDSESNVPYTKSTVSVKIRSLLDASLEYTGQVSGKQYRWNKAGSVVLVDAEDSEILLAKRIGGKLCCGNHPDTNRIFEIAL